MGGLPDKLSRTGRRNLQRFVSKARTRPRPCVVEAHRGGRRERHIVYHLPLVVPLAEFAAERAPTWTDGSRDFLRSHQRILQHDRRVLLDQFHLVDVARKVVGVGSVGTDAWIALFVGRDDATRCSCRSRRRRRGAGGVRGRERPPHAGERVVAGQRITQATRDIFLGWMRVKQTIHGASRDYYVRQLRDWKGSVVVEAMPRGGWPPTAGSAGRRSPARTPARATGSPSPPTSGPGTAFDSAILRFSEAYAEQNERDHAALVDAVRSGRIVAQAEL